MTHVRLVPMTEEKVVDDQTVLVQGKTIVQAGPSTQVHIPEDALVIDGKGAYLLPGLADMHMHTRSDWPTAYPVSPLKLYLANGVTSIRCFGPLGGSGQYVLDWREAIRTGKRIGPFISTCGPILYAFGTIEAGKRADLILVKENPLEDVAHLKELSGVMAAGRWYDRAALQKMMALPDNKAGSHPPSLN